MSEALQDMLDEEIRKGTFTQDALAQFQKISQKAGELQRELTRRLDDTRRSERELETCNALKDQAVVALAEAQKIADAKAADSVALARAEARADTYAECFRLVFRNAEISRAVTTPHVLTDHWPDGNGSHGSNQRVEHTTSTTQETVE